MKSFILFLLFTFLYGFGAYCQYSLQWNRTYGEAGWDQANSIIETYDRGLVIAGHSRFEDENRFMRLVKIDEFGEVLWDRTFKDYYNSAAEAVIEAKNHDLVVTGSCIKDGEYFSNVWVVRLDEFGTLKWEKNYGGSGDDAGADIVETLDNGFAVVGFTDSTMEMGIDFYMLKLNSQGDKEWEKTFGGMREDYAKSISFTSDYSYIMAGYTLDSQSKRSFWLIKADEQGEIIWDNILGDSHWDVATSIIETSDNNYAVTGYTKASGVVNYDIRAMKVDGSGNPIWNHSFGKGNWDEGSQIIETYDKGLAISGFSRSRDDKFSNFWVIKLAASGEKVWEQVFRRTSLDYASSITETYDKGIAMAGYTYDGTARNWQFAVLKFTNKKKPEFQFRHPESIESITISPTYKFRAVISSHSPVENFKFFFQDTLRHDISTFEGNEVVRQVNDSTLVIEKQLQLYNGPNRFQLKASSPDGTAISETYIVNYITPPLIVW